MEGKSPDVGKPVANRDVGQAGATRERFSPTTNAPVPADDENKVGDRYVGKAAPAAIPISRKPETHQ